MEEKKSQTELLEFYVKAYETEKEKADYYRRLYMSLLEVLPDDYIERSRESYHSKGSVSISEADWNAL